MRRPRHQILFHGHEPLDTDARPTLVGKDWLVTTGRGHVANLSGVPKAPLQRYVREVRPALHWDADLGIRVR